MLQTMRQLAHSWVFKGLMLLLVASFGIWGIGDMLRGNPLTRTVAKVGDDKITVGELNRAFGQAFSRMRQTLGPDFTAQQAKQMGVAEQALNELVETSLFDQELKRLGIEADDRTVFQLLQNDERLKDKDGKFDKRILQAYLMQMQKSESEFLTNQRKVLASGQLLDALSSVPHAPSSIIDALYRARAEKRIVNIVSLDNAGIPKAEAPDEKTLRDYYQNHPEPFTRQEMRGMTIAVLSTENMARDIVINDGQAKKEYDAKGEQLAEPESRDLLQVVLQDEGKAKTLSAAAKTSGDLASAAKPTGRVVVPLNHTEESGLFPELAKPVFALPQGGVTDPIHTDLGWHVIQVRKIIPAGVPPFDTIKEKLRETMKNDQAADRTARDLNKLDDELAAGHTLEDIADEMRLRLIKIPLVDAHGKMADGKEPAEFPNKEDMLKQAFAQNSGETSPVMDNKNGTYSVVRTDDVTPGALKPFETVKADVLAAWQKQEQTKRAAQEADKIAKSLREGKAASSFSGQAGIDVRASKPVSYLGDSDPSLPKDMLPKLLALKKGDAVVFPEDGKQWIVSLSSVAAAGKERDEGAEGKITLELNDGAPKELTDEYLRYLRVLFPVTIERDAYEGIAPSGGS